MQLYRVYDRRNGSMRWRLVGQFIGDAPWAQRLFEQVVRGWQAVQHPGASRAEVGLCWTEVETFELAPVTLDRNMLLPQVWKKAEKD